jgi:hypothetical protein
MAVVIPLLGRLEALLVDSDGAALDCVLEAQEALARVLSAEELAGLTREVQNFAFDAALVELRAIAARIGRRPPARRCRPGRSCGGWKSRCRRRRQALVRACGAGAAGARIGRAEAGALLREVGNFDFDAALIRVRSRRQRPEEPLSAL